MSQPDDHQRRSEQRRRFLQRAEFDGQQVQARCFVVSSFRNSHIVRQAVARLRQHQLFVYDFTNSALSQNQADWSQLSLDDAQTRADMHATAQSDLMMLQYLGPGDVVLLILPAGFSAGWEVGYATARGAYIVVATQDQAITDLPLLHADVISPTVDEAVDHIIDYTQPHTT